MSNQHPLHADDDPISPLARPDQRGPDAFPRLGNLSAGFMFNALPKPAQATAPEYVYLSLDGLTGDERIATQLGIANWNLAWEAAQLRPPMFGARHDTPRFIQKVIDAAPDDANIFLLPETTVRYREYAPLYHLLPLAVLARHGLPPLASGDWPDPGISWGAEQLLPPDFEARLGRAFAEVLWPRLGLGGRPGDFSSNDPGLLLAHNLDHWVPAVTRVMMQILESFRRGPRGEEEDPERLRRLAGIQRRLPDGITAVSPKMGGDLWSGEVEASEVLDWAVDEADPDGRLRAILDAIKSNRVHDDFSPRWSKVKDDFDRKINHKRAKTKVAFVELADTVPVQAPYTEVEDNIVFADFMALLDPKERRIVVLLRSGYTRVGEIASVLGYANHSPVSKRLDRIRAKARQVFDST